MKKFRKKQIPKTTAGYKVAVCSTETKHQHSNSTAEDLETLLGTLLGTQSNTHTKGSFPPPMALQGPIQAASKISSKHTGGRAGDRHQEDDEREGGRKRQVGGREGGRGREKE